jgi:hypothetical protein
VCVDAECTDKEGGKGEEEGGGGSCLCGTFICKCPFVFWHVPSVVWLMCMRLLHVTVLHFDGKAVYWHGLLIVVCHHF